MPVIRLLLSWFWSALRTLGRWFYRFGLRLIMERDEEKKAVVSLGRLAFFAVLVQFFILWHRALFSGIVTEAPPGLLEVFYTLAAYVLGTKIVRAGAEALVKRKRPSLLPPRPDEEPPTCP
jgi:hypothetical protein